MARFAITSVFEVGVQSAPTIGPLEPVVAPVTADEGQEFCAFTADLVRVADDRTDRDASRHRHPSSVSWLRPDGAPGEVEAQHDADGDHRAA